MWRHYNKLAHPIIVFQKVYQSFEKASAIMKSRDEKLENPQPRFTSKKYLLNLFLSCSFYSSQNYLLVLMHAKSVSM